LSFFTAAALTIFFLILFLGIFLNFFGLPGTVVIFFDVLMFSAFTGFEQIGFNIILILFFCAVAAEAVEFYAVADESDQPVYSKRSVWSAAAGALTGVFLLTPFWGGPGAWTGFVLGGLTGLLMTEIIRQYRLKPPHRTLRHALVSITGKNLIKGFISLFMIAFSLAHIYS